MVAVDSNKTALEETLDQLIKKEEDNVAKNEADIQKRVDKSKADLEKNTAKERKEIEHSSALIAQYQEAKQQASKLK